MKDVPDTKTKNASEPQVVPQSIEAARESVPAVLPRVVIVGAGFGGLHAARALRDAPVQVTGIDRNNHHLFQPLLYQVATGVLSPAEISAPIRSVLRKQKNAEVLLAEVTGIDVEGQHVLMGDDFLHYDYLILATGARDAYFGHNDWAAFAPGLQSIVQATAIRRNILLAFEMAEKEKDLKKRRGLLTFVLVGAGPTGVEMAGAIGGLAHNMDKGNMAVIERFYGIAAIGKFRIAGLLGWFLWMVLHLMFLIGFRNRVVVALQWFVYFTTFQRGARLITYEDASSQR